MRVRLHRKGGSLEQRVREVIELVEKGLQIQHSVHPPPNERSWIEKVAEGVARRRKRATRHKRIENEFLGDWIDRVEWGSLKLSERYD
jgi:hypothetical protein